VAVLDRVAERLVLLHERFGERVRLVGGVVEYLHLQFVLRIVHLERLFDESLDDVFLVVQR
jgi:hypothetical protein